jgi:hypothetical protein
MQDDLELFLVEGMVRRLASLIKSTEVAVFGVALEKLPEDRLTLICHIGSGKGTAEAREATIDAFKRTVLNCAVRGESGFYKVANSRDQYCLVTLFMGKQGVQGAAAFITRANEKAKIMLKLNALNGIAP